jgi:hypothetical protein
MEQGSAKTTGSMVAFLASNSCFSTDTTIIDSFSDPKIQFLEAKS